MEVRVARRELSENQSTKARFERISKEQLTIRTLKEAKG